MTIYVDRYSDANFSACSAAANDGALRGAINTADELWISGLNGMPKVDALNMTSGNVFTVTVVL